MGIDLRSCQYDEITLCEIELEIPLKNITVKSSLCSDGIWVVRFLSKGLQLRPWSWLCSLILCSYTQRQRARKRESGREREQVCVCERKIASESVCERERDRDSERQIDGAEWEREEDVDR